MAFFICGSEKVSQSSATSSLAKKPAMHSMLVRKNATFFMPSSSAVLAPCHMRAPLMSMPMKFFSGKRRASPMVYSPRPQPSSSTMGLSFLKNSSCHFPFSGNPSCCSCQKGHSTTSGFSAISANFANFPLPISSVPIEILLSVYVIPHSVATSYSVAPHGYRRAFCRSPHVNVLPCVATRFSDVGVDRPQYAVAS